jgi:hypothetical protein
MIDTDYSIQLLIQTGMQEAQARAVIRGIIDAQTELVSKRDLKDAINELKTDITDVKNTIVLLEKTSGLQFRGLYILLFALCSGMVKLIFYP